MRWGHLSQTNLIVRYCSHPAETNFVDAAKVNLRKHRSAVWRSAVPNLGVTCPPFFRCEAPPFLQFAVFQRLSLPCTDHLWFLPCAAKQISDRLPVSQRESECDSVLTRKEKHSPFLVVQDRRVS